MTEQVEVAVSDRIIPVEILQRAINDSREQRRKDSLVGQSRSPVISGEVLISQVETKITKELNIVLNSIGTLPNATADSIAGVIANVSIKNPTIRKAVAGLLNNFWVGIYEQMQKPVGENVVNPVPQSVDIVKEDQSEVGVIAKEEKDTDPVDKYWREVNEKNVVVGGKYALPDQDGVVAEVMGKTIFEKSLMRAYLRKVGNEYPPATSVLVVLPGDVVKCIPVANLGQRIIELIPPRHHSY